MARFLIYLFPAMFDMAMTCVLLTSGMRMAASGAPATATTAVTAMWAIGYILSCLLIGRWIKPTNAAKVIIVGGVVTASGAAGFLVFPGLFLMYLFVAIVSIGGAMFFLPFQVFMKAADQEHGSPSVVRATALYTLSWSSGYAAGPFVAGVVWSVTGAWEYGYVFSAASALSVSLGILLFHRYTKRKSRAIRADNAPAPQPQASVLDQQYANMPDLAWLGWVGSGAGVLCFAVIIGMFPVTGNNHHLPKDQQGMVIALMLGAQAITGLLLGLGRFWMYRRVLVGVCGLLGMAGLVLFALGESAGTFCLAAVCFGVYSGSFFFYLVFHAIIHPHRSARYVSINETIVGVGGFIGPIAGGLLADAKGPAWPYLAAVGLVATGILLKLIVHTRIRSCICEL